MFRGTAATDMLSCH